MIWLLASRWEPGGLERVQYNLARALRTQGRAVRIVAGRHAGGPGDEGDVRCIAPAGAVQFLWRLPGYIRRHQPEVVMTTSNDVAVWLLACRRWAFPRTRVVVSQHLSISGPRLSAKGLRRMKLEAIRWTMRWAFRKADALVAVSAGVAKDMHDELGLQGCNIEVIYNPVVDGGEAAAPEVPKPIAWPFDLDDVPVIVFAGRLAPEKRLDLLLRAFTRVRAARPARLLVLGEGEMSAELRAGVEAAGIGSDCAMPGRVDDIAPWLKRSALLVLPSDYEGFGNVLVEAMQAGTQVVATDCPSGPAEILAGGVYGQLVPVGDAQALAAAILASLDRRFHVPVEALRRRAQEFSIARSRQAYERVLHAVLSREPVSLRELR
ncbi:MAG TPA: glycosyltransferase [Stenotrophomonas sp.]|nr:glycosyltransferase [Stenotrophomonas sp.]